MNVADKKQGVMVATGNEKSCGSICSDNPDEFSLAKILNRFCAATSDFVSVEIVARCYHALTVENKMYLCPTGKSAVWLWVADEAVNNWENVNRD
jgi:hypothetical protein